MGKLKDIRDAVVAGNDDEIKDLVRRALDRGIAPLEIINEGVIPGLDVVGARFQSGDMFIPEMMLSAITAKAGVAVATERLKPGEYTARGPVVLGTVKGDVHDIGKNLVALVLRTRGFEVIDLGVDVHEVEFVNAVREYRPQILGISALMTTTMVGMKDVIAALTEAGLRDNVKVVVGGAPVNDDFASQIGADSYASDAGAAASLLERLLAEIEA